VTYKREPFDPHGSQNFTDREVKWFTENSSSETTRSGTAQTDTYFGPKGQGAKGHIAHDEHGNYLYGRDVDGSPITDK
ncbi:MAG: hypothetical protein WCP56_03915, partial [Candidatus Saccharibacteria bacterium]